jgi:hypothetical protein
MLEAQGQGFGFGVDRGIAVETAQEVLLERAVESLDFAVLCAAPDYVQLRWWASAVQAIFPP